jgi:hypothetical protein
MDEFMSYPPGLLQALGVDPEQLRRQQMQSGLLSAGLQLLAGSGYSPVRRTTGELLGQAGAVGLQGYQQAGESAIDRALRGLQVQQMGKKQEEERMVREAMTAPTMQEQIQRLRTLGRYDLIKNIAESQQAVRKAGLGEQQAAGVELENPFLPYTMSQSPQVKQLAQTYSKGFASGRIDEDRADKVIETLGRMEADFMRGAEAREDRRLTRDLAQMERETKRLEGTPEQKLSAGFASRMEAANSILDQLEATPAALPTATTETLGGVPLVGGYLRRKAMSPDQQKYRQAAQNWIRANLRKESGAAIGDQEMENEYETYFPVPGDTPEVIEQKREARAITTQAMIRNAGPTYTPTFGAALPKPKQVKDKYGLE